MSQLRVLHFPALHGRWQLRLETQVIRFFQDEAQLFVFVFESAAGILPRLTGLLRLLHHASPDSSALRLQMSAIQTHIHGEPPSSEVQNRISEVASEVWDVIERRQDPV